VLRTVLSQTLQTSPPARKRGQTGLSEPTGSYIHWYGPCLLRLLSVLRQSCLHWLVQSRSKYLLNAHSFKAALPIYEKRCRANGCTCMGVHAWMYRVPTANGCICIALSFLSDYTTLSYPSRSMQLHPPCAHAKIYWPHFRNAPMSILQCANTI
jgi:hypothetical protein